MALFLVFNLHVLQVPQSTASFSWPAGVEEAGGAGVCLFFTLSAFLITELLLRERASTGTIHTRAFYVRRVLRIWPLYLSAIASAVILSYTVGHVFTPVGWFIAPFLLLCGNWAIVIHGWMLNPMLSPLWSISIEEQFYLIWPFLLLRFGPKGVLRVAAVLLPLAWLLDFLIPALGHTKSPALWTNSLNQFQFFAIGGGFAVLTHGRTFHPRRALRIAAFVFAPVLLFVAAKPFQYINDSVHTHASYTLLGYLCIDCACLLLLAAFLGATLPRLAQPFIYLGKISYGLYVFHFSVYVVVAALLRLVLPPSPVLHLILAYIATAAITILVASASYRFLEMPFLRLKKRFTFVPSRPA